MTYEPSHKKSQMNSDFVLLYTVTLHNSKFHQICSQDHTHLTLPFLIEDVHGPAEVINGIPLYVATPFSSVNRCCIHSKEGFSEN